MELEPTPLILLTFLAAVILVSGCTGLDPAALAKSNSLIQQFLDEHPNAQIKVTHFTAEQAKNMIDQIRSDCDNPYLDEKEFYRVNITDPDTDFFAVVWIDWANNSIECVYKIGTEGKTIEKPRQAEQCESHTYHKCDSGNLYWFDSCGNKQEKKEYCQYGCSGQSCLGDCSSNAEYRCYGDHVHWFDSCGNKQEKKEYCDYGCENGLCKPKPAEKTCEEAGGYCIWPAAATAISEAVDASTATGMLIVTAVTTSTSTQVMYQCKEGYGVGNYFCKEGGICCVPKVTTGFCGSSTQGPCESDSDCVTGGCSGQVCQSVQEEPAASTCEYKECYSAVKYGMECKCMGSPTTTAGNAGKCMWTKPVACTDDAKVCPDGSAVSRNPNKNCEFDPCPATKYYRNAYWQCYDGAEANEGGETSCKSYETWKQYAEDYCKGRCASISATVSAEAAKKCGVNTFNVWNECYPSIPTCAKEGEQFSAVYKEKYPEHCCSGLTEWNSGMDTRKVENGICVETNLVAGSPVGTCINCGDGVCGKYETICNCPDDCKSETCKDSDGGKNYYQTGTAVAAGQSLTDHCNNDGTLTEKYCSEKGQISAEVYQCPYGCSEGACITPAQ